MSIVKPKMYWPLSIDSSNRRLVIRVSGVDYNVDIATGTYSSAAQLAAAITAAANALGSIGAFWAWDITQAGHIKLMRPDGAFQVRNDGTLNSNVGFFALDLASTADPAEYPAGPFGVTGPLQMRNGWWSPVAVAVDGLKEVDRSQHTVTRAMSGQTKFIADSELNDRNLVFRFLPPEYTYIQFTSNLNGGTARAIENLWRNGYAKFRYWPDMLTEGTYEDLVMATDTLQRWLPQRQFRNKALYEVALRCWYFVT